MRTTRWLPFALSTLGLCGCITTTRQIDARGVPGTVVTEVTDTSAQKIERAQGWLDELAMDGVKESNQRGHTLFLIRQLIENRPQSTDVVLERGVPHQSPKVRENSAFFLGYAADRRAEQALIGMLEDPVESVRLSAAASLVTGYAEKAGVPVLLRALYSDQIHYRREAVKNLRIYTQMYFAYQPAASRSERDFSAGKWESWWREHGDSFVPPINGRPTRQ